ncbi:heavy metal-binding domain-containing protein [Sphingobacterium siyangense]|uniref:heavy metal-binding domain-containing protein n=1 Tax=Sphingobacterium siyangense TaxID=459529 RepID=UPI000E74D11D|nr:heavy metal-binding domain-containing protein [Sphingobacterium siyangense]QRY60521.1 heavy metal-binding domain-containing protein [Sphingobacterium siyangense]
MIVTTTNSIEGREISRYNNPIAANVVISTNIFSDIAASYVDSLAVDRLVIRRGCTL